MIVKYVWIRSKRQKIHLCPFPALISDLSHCFDRTQLLPQMFFCIFLCNCTHMFSPDKVANLEPEDLCNHQIADRTTELTVIPLKLCFGGEKAMFCLGKHSIGSLMRGTMSTTNTNPKQFKYDWEGQECGCLRTQQSQRKNWETCSSLRRTEPSGFQNDSHVSGDVLHCKFCQQETCRSVKTTKLPVWGG